MGEVIELLKHGQINKFGNSRRCKEHGMHGFLYVCDKYSIELKKEIEELGERFRKECKEGTIKFTFTNQT